MKTLSILIVEDSPLAMLAHKNMLKNMGYHADGAFSAEEALKLYFKKQYDLILNDIRLPKMSGLAMALKIRQFERKYCLPSAKIITITGYDVQLLKSEMAMIGIKHALHKPIQSCDLQKIIKSYEKNLALV